MDPKQRAKLAAMAGYVAVKRPDGSVYIPPPPDEDEGEDAIDINGPEVEAFGAPTTNPALKNVPYARTPLRARVYQTDARSGAGRIVTPSEIDRTTGLPTQLTSGALSLFHSTTEGMQALQYALDQAAQRDMLRAVGRVSAPPVAPAASREILITKRRDRNASRP